MTYLEFLLLFLGVPLAALAVFLRRRLRDRRFLAATAVLALIALAYMAPWDHLAATWGLWRWSPGQSVGARWWAIPPEEYLFCILEALLATALAFVALRWRRRGGSAPVSDQERQS